MLPIMSAKRFQTCARRFSTRCSSVCLWSCKAWKLWVRRRMGHQQTKRKGQHMFLKDMCFLMFLIFLQSWRCSYDQFCACCTRCLHADTWHDCQGWNSATKCEAFPGQGWPIFQYIYIYMYIENWLTDFSLNGCLQKHVYFCKTVFFTVRSTWVSKMLRKKLSRRPKPETTQWPFLMMKKWKKNNNKTRNNMKQRAVHMSFRPVIAAWRCMKP